jgi:multiple sugar transport system permease protein
VTNRQLDRLGDIGTYAVYLLVLVFFVIPLVWLLSLSFRTAGEVYIGEIRLIPHEPTIENYEIVLSNDLFPGYLWNGLVLSVLGALGAMVLAAPAAYAFSRFRFRFRYALLIAVLLFQMISPLVIMVPLYRHMDAMGLTESHFGAVMLYIAISVPLFTWMLKGFLDRIPPSLEDSAMIDGCSRFGAFMRIVLPLSLPGLASAFILNAILGWSQFLVPYVLLSRPNLLPIAVGIFNFHGSYQASATQVVAAASIISILPAIAIFLLLQRLIIGALMAGAVKG